MAVQFWMVVFYVAVARGKRNWKQYYAYLKGFLLYFGQVLLSRLLTYTYIHVHACTCIYTYIINCQLGKTTHCTFMCTFLERIKCKEASLEGGGRERGNLQLVIVGRKQCTCTCTFREWVGN